MGKPEDFFSIEDEREAMKASAILESAVQQCAEDGIKPFTACVIMAEILSRLLLAMSDTNGAINFLSKTISRITQEGPGFLEALHEAIEERERGEDDNKDPTVH